MWGQLDPCLARKDMWPPWQQRIATGKAQYLWSPMVCRFLLRQFASSLLCLSFWARNWCTAQEKNSPKAGSVEALTAKACWLVLKKSFHNFHNSKMSTKETHERNAHLPGALSSPSLVRRQVKQLATNGWHQKIRVMVSEAGFDAPISKSWEENSRTFHYAIFAIPKTVTN